MRAAVYLKVGTGVTLGVIAGLAIVRLSISTQESLNDVQRTLDKIPLYVTGGTVGAVNGGVLLNYTGLFRTHTHNTHVRRRCGTCRYCGCALTPGTWRLRQGPVDYYFCSEAHADLWVLVRETSPAS